ncbi:hypothetical protein [Psychroflexus aestuariivivens]|uniref:hypothetical protein n=1 Tax=Psychroflexus aestuariivivens TaxID=1795040 RepID=UPI000FD909CC|nr:hypothetical protein [Psychroflexus aestuariivivens]
MMTKKILLGLFVFSTLISCVDDRDVDFSGIEANPTYEANFVDFNFSAEDINNGNSESGNVYSDATEIDFFEQDINLDHLESLSFQMNVESTINSELKIDLQFVNQEEEIAFRRIESTRTIRPGYGFSPNYEIVEFNLTETEIMDVIQSDHVIISVSQESEATNNGTFELKSLARFSYLYTQ